MNWKVSGRKQLCPNWCNIPAFSCRHGGKPRKISFKLVYRSWLEQSTSPIRAKSLVSTPMKSGFLMFLPKSSYSQTESVAAELALACWWGRVEALLNVGWSCNVRNSPKGLWELCSLQVFPPSLSLRIFLWLHKHTWAWKTSISVQETGL